MTKLIKTRIFWAGISVWALFFPALIWLELSFLFELMTGLTFAASVTVLHAYWPAMLDSANKNVRDMDIIDYLTLGIMCTWASIAARFAYLAYLSVVEGYHPLAETSSVLAFTQYVTFTGAVLHLSARRVLRGEIPTSSWPRVAFAITIGAVLGVGLHFYP